MKSCLSLIIAILIVAAFIGTAAFLWYGSSTTEFSEGPFIKAPSDPSDSSDSSEPAEETPKQ